MNRSIKNVLSISIEAFVIGSLVAFVATVVVAILLRIGIEQAAQYTIGVGAGTAGAIVLSKLKKRKYSVFGV